MKRLLIQVFLISLLLNNFCYAEADVVNFDKQNGVNTSTQFNVEYKIDSKISKELKDAIEDVYGKENVDKIYATIIEKVIASIKSRPAELKQQD